MITETETAFLAVVRAFLTEEKAALEELAALTEKQWNHLFVLAAQHSLLPAVYDVVGKTPEFAELPDELRRQVKTQAMQSILQQVSRTALFLTDEKELEQRIAGLLDRVEGVGKADVMVVLKSSEERVFHVDKNSRTSATEEKGEDGRTVREQELSESTVMGGGNQGPVVEKELTPEVAGIVISADGGGSASVRAEISEAMEALFGLPAHKIKVLKRVKEGV